MGYRRVSRGNYFFFPTQKMVIPRVSLMGETSFRLDISSIVESLVRRGIAKKHADGMGSETSPRKARRGFSENKSKNIF